MKKITSLFLALIMILCAMPFSITSFAEDEEQEEFIPVYTIEDLYAINNNMSGNYKLMNDIDMTEATAEGGDWDYMGNGWNPIGSENNYSNTSFSGIFDGNNHKIIGMRINLSTDFSGTGTNKYLGLFASVSGKIDSLVLENIYISGESTFNNVYCGTIAAETDEGIIINCSANGNIICPSNSISYSADKINTSGGLVGKAKNSVIERCFNSTTILGGYYVGGIVGYSTGTTTISKSFNSGSLTTDLRRGNDYSTGTSSLSGTYYRYSSRAGGITIGESNVVISDCYNSGNITGISSTDTVGNRTKCTYSSDIYGILYGGKSINCYNSGMLESKYDDSRVAIGGNITNSYYLADTGTSSTSATSLTQYQMGLQLMFNGFDFENVWYIDSTADYKYPQLKSNPHIYPKVTQGITLDISNMKTSYLEGEDFDSTGIVVIADYEQGPSEAVVGYTVSGFTGDLGENIITVTYKDKTATFTVKVHSPEVLESKAPTCTETGLTEGLKCSHCGDVLVAQEVVKENGHTVVTDKAVSPTCTATGLTEGSHCDVCKEVLVTQEVVKENGHTVIIDKAVAPTCTTTGLTEGKHCSVCNEVFIEQTIVQATNHDDKNSDGYCDECAIELPSHNQGADKCDCICHKTSFLKYIYKVIRIFWYLFSTNEFCSCGAAHY